MKVRRVGDRQPGGLQESQVRGAPEPVGRAVQQPAEVLEVHHAAAVRSGLAGEAGTERAQALHEGRHLRLEDGCGTAERRRFPPARFEAPGSESGVLVADGEDVLGEAVDEPQRPQEQAVHGRRWDPRRAVLASAFAPAEYGGGVIALPRGACGSRSSSGSSSRQDQSRRTAVIRSCIASFERPVASRSAR